MAVKSYRELITWQKAMDLVELTYQGTKSFPNDERFGLTNQMRRAAVSVPSNIAEGQARSTADFMRFLTIARGSVLELETQILIAQRLRYLDDRTTNQLTAATDEVSRLSSGLSRSLKEKK